MARGGFGCPARCNTPLRHQFAIAGGADLDDIGNRPDRRSGLKRRVDNPVNLARHGKAAIGPGRARYAFQFKLAPLTQEAVNKGSARRIGNRAGPRQHRAQRQRCGRILPCKDGFQRVGLGFIIHHILL